MIKIVKESLGWASGLFSGILTLFPERMFTHWHWISREMLSDKISWNWVNIDDLNIIITRICLFIIVVIICQLVFCICSHFKKIMIKGRGYSIVIEYGDIFKFKNCQRVISFDECYTICVGTNTADIKRDTICGQYLINNPNLDMDSLIQRSNIIQCRRRSKHNNKICYQPGSIVPNGDDLLMAFTKLDSNGKSLKFTIEDYLKCLEKLWKELDNNYCQKDVCIPVLGSGITRFENGINQSVSKEELIELIISSYKLSKYKLKDLSTLHIVCKRSSDFSLDRICKSYTSYGIN